MLRYCWKLKYFFGLLDKQKIFSAYHLTINAILDTCTVCKRFTLGFRVNINSIVLFYSFAFASHVHILKKVLKTMEFELAQSILTNAIYVIWYAFSTLLILDFLVGIPAFMRRVEMKKFASTPPRNTTVPTCTGLIINGKEVKIQLPYTQEINSESIIPRSNIDEATVEYLQMVGADIEDFETIAQAPEFLNDNAAWTIETETSLAQPKQLLVETEVQDKLTCQQVQAEFAKLGWKFEKYRTGHNRYRVNIDGLCHRFKTLNDALDWLNVSKRLIQVAAK